jgi:phosphocarrier protein
MHGLSLTPPLDGIARPLSAVPDEVFAQGLMGAGLAIEPLSTVLRAPCPGVVIQLARSRHALTLRADGGAHILLHIGIDTVDLGGEGFVALVEEGQHVECGQALINFDADRVASRVPSLMTVVVVTDPGASIADLAAGPVRAGEGSLFSIQIDTTEREGTPAAGDGLPAVVRRVTVGHEGGLHARPAARVQQAARQHGARVSLRCNGRLADARSVVALMNLALSAGQQVDVVAEGEDAAAAADAVAAVVAAHSSSGHGEGTAGRQPAAGTDGLVAAPGLAVGTVLRWQTDEVEVPADGEGVDAELARLSGALQTLGAELAAEAREDDDGAAMGILGAHRALLDDAALIVAAEQAVLAGHSAGHAWRQACAAQIRALRATGSELLAERAGDVRDVELRLLQAMGYATPAEPVLVADAILVCDDLTPAQFSRLDPARLAGIMTVQGGVTSHVAIMARALGIPALVAVGRKLLALADGETVVLDADRGRFETVSDPEQIDAARVAMAVAAEARRDAERAAAAPAMSRDGVEIEVAANVGNVAEARRAVAAGADGIGLLRSELLFMDRDRLPDPAEQGALYREVLQLFGERPVTVRTLDIGGDKEAPYLRLPAEDNPALGLRGVRLALVRPDVVDGQLRALLQSSTAGHLRLLLPMIGDLADLRAMRRRIEAAAAAVALPALPEIGIMIEVPSAALVAGQLAEEADFLSIGTNDLSQYTLAVDRGHPSLSDRLDAMHPAVLRLIDTATSAARDRGKWVGVCGGLAADLVAVPVLLGFGVTELSVGPAALATVKARVRAQSVADCRRRVGEVLRQESAVAARALAAELWPMEQGCGPKG